MAIPFVKNLDVEYGRCGSLSPLVQRVTANNPGPFTYTGTGVFIIGHEKVCVIDPGPKTDAHHAALQKALDGRTVTHVLLTHHHADHSPLAAPLAAEHGCKVYGQSLARTNTETATVKMDADNDLSFNPDIELSDGNIIAGDGWTLETLHTPGHTSNHLCFALKEENTLFSGDHIMGWSTSVVIPPDGDMKDYMASLQKIYDRHFDVIRPTHGPAINDVDVFVRAYIDHRVDREAQILSAVQEGISDIYDIVSKLYTHIDKRLYPAAAQSVLSHLIHLRGKGDITVDGPNTLKQKYYPPHTS